MANTLKFLKTYEAVEIPACSSGNITEPTYVQRYKKDGEPYLQETGTKNLQEIVKSNKDVCNYEKIIRRYQQTGDATLLMRSSGMYEDMTQNPETLIEAYDMIERAKTAFYSLPLDKRELYGNSFTKFIADLGSDEWLSAFGFDTVAGSSESAIEEHLESEVKTDAE